MGGWVGGVAWVGWRATRERCASLVVGQGGQARARPRRLAHAAPAPAAQPPICFTEAQADRMVDAMAAVLDALSPEQKRQLAAQSAREVVALRPQCPSRL